MACTNDWLAVQTKAQFIKTSGLHGGCTGRGNLGSVALRHGVTPLGWVKVAFMFVNG
jgi:hypothetical protein